MPRKVQHQHASIARERWRDSLPREVRVAQTVQENDGWGATRPTVLDPVQAHTVYDHVDMLPLVRFITPSIAVTAGTGAENRDGGHGTREHTTQPA